MTHVPPGLQSVRQAVQRHSMLTQIPSLWQHLAAVHPAVYIIS